MGVMLRTLQQLGGGAGAGGGGSACLKALSLRLVCALWRQQDRCFPYLLQMIAERDFSAGGGVSLALGVDEVALAKAACIRDVCQVR